VQREPNGALEALDDRRPVPRVHGGQARVQIVVAPAAEQKRPEQLVGGVQPLHRRLQLGVAGGGPVARRPQRLAEQLDRIDARPRLLGAGRRRRDQQTHPQPTPRKAHDGSPLRNCVEGAAHTVGGAAEQGQKWDTDEHGSDGLARILL
jgi:hypothetical protein